MDGEIEQCDLEKRYIHADGHIIWANTVVTLLDETPGHPRARIAQIQDITEKKRASDEMSYQAMHDQLTGLPNRRSLFTDLERSLRDASEDRPLSFATLRPRRVQGLQRHVRPPCGRLAARPPGAQAGGRR